MKSSFNNKFYWVKKTFSDFSFSRKPQNYIRLFSARIVKGS